MNHSAKYPQKRYEKPDGATDILLIRHGQSRAFSLESPFDLVDGQGDPELSQEGVEQAQCLAERLKHQNIDALYVTNLRRTVETAAPLAKWLHLVPQVEADLREVHLGEWEGGLLRAKAAAADPLYFKMNEQEDWGVIPGGESTEKLRTRIKAGLHRIVAAHPNQRVAVVCHGGVIASLLSIATQSRPFAFLHVDNASISHIVVAGNKIILRSFNDVSHLEKMTHARSALSQ